MTKSTLSIIIVNWNSDDQLKRCVNSISKAKNEYFVLNEVIIVDNHSEDNSLTLLNRMDLPLRIIENKKNLGFGKACNQGGLHSKSKYLLFLNPDTELFENSLDIPIKYMEDELHKDVGIVGIQLLGDDGKITRNTSRFPNATRFISQFLFLDRAFPKIFKPHFVKEWDHKTTQKVDQIMGAFFLIRRDIFDRLNGFDERFFVYFEDVDLTLRTKKLGKDSLYLANAKAYHKGAGVSMKVPSRRYFYFQRSRILYYFKHFSKTIAILNVLFVYCVDPFIRLFLRLLFLRFRELKADLKAQYFLWKDLKNIIKKASKIRAKNG